MSAWVVGGQKPSFGDGAVEWPSALPLPLRSQYSVEFGDGRRITEMDQGMPHIELAYNNVPDSQQLNFIFEPGDISLFRQFWRWDLRMGTKSFFMPLFDDDVLDWFEVKFVSSMRVNLIAARGVYSASVDARTRAFVNAST